jgi:hypothetical protein
MKEGWEGLLGVKLFLIVVARAGQDINMADFLSLGDDSLKVVRVPEGMSSMQASQWARIFAAGLVEAPPGGMNIISDMDMLPASARYFHAPLHRLRKEESEMLVCCRHGIFDNAKEIAVGCIAGHPGAWRRLTGVHSWEDFGRALKIFPTIMAMCMVALVGMVTSLQFMSGSTIQFVQMAHSWPALKTKI